MRQHYQFKFAENSSDTKIVFTERGKRMVFENPRRRTYLRAHIDGVEIKDGSKCDYLLAKYDCVPEEEYFVELKGIDVIHGIEQLEETIKVVSIDARGLAKYAFVVSKNVSTTINTKVQISIKKFRKNYKTELVVKEMRCTHSLY